MFDCYGTSLGPLCAFASAMSKWSEFNFLHTLADAAAVASEGSCNGSLPADSWLPKFRELQSDTDLITFSSNDVVAEKLPRALASDSSGNPAPVRNVFEDPPFEALVTLRAEPEAVSYTVALPVGDQRYNVTVAPFSAVNGVISPSVGG